MTSQKGSGRLEAPATRSPRPTPSRSSRKPRRLPVALSVAEHERAVRVVREAFPDAVEVTLPVDRPRWTFQEAVAQAKGSEHPRGQDD